jgi:hypothetical protein
VRMNDRPADVVLSDLAKAEVFPALALARQTEEVRHLDYHATAYFIPADFEVQKHDYGSTNEGRGYSNWGRTAASRLLRSAATLDSTRPLRRNIHPNLTHWYNYSLKQNARRLLPRVSTSVEK